MKREMKGFQIPPVVTVNDVNSEFSYTLLLDIYMNNLDSHAKPMQIIPSLVPGLKAGEESGTRLAIIM